MGNFEFPVLLKKSDDGESVVVEHVAVDGVVSDRKLGSRYNLRRRNGFE